MQPSPIDARALGKSGIDALKRGDAISARMAFEQIVRAGQADASICLALAYACRSMTDGAAALDAVDQALAREPRNLRALIFKADQLDAAGDVRAASAFYLAAVKAAAETETLPVDLRDEVAHAQEMCNRYAAQFGEFLKGRLVGRGLSDGQASQRFRQSLDILSGAKTRYFQEPRYYFFPELPQIQFFDRGEFPWLEKLEVHTAAIRAELLEVMKEDSAFQPYVQANPNRPVDTQDQMLNNADWGAFYLWRDGEIVQEHAARCPKTMAALCDVPLARVNNRSPSVLFSLLRPGARILPHTGMVNTRLIGHLPLIVPEGCRFRVGNEIRPWIEGQSWLFDDSIEHEAWNDSEKVRVILLFEIWRPELTLEERELVSAMFDAIDAHAGEKTVWEN